MKMQEVVEVLETNAKSKKCNPVEAGLYKFKMRKLDSGVLYSGCIFPILRNQHEVLDAPLLPGCHSFSAAQGTRLCII